MIDVLLIALLTAVLGLSGLAIWKSKKKGKTCMGCPDNCACAKGNCTVGCTGCKK